MLYIIEGKPYIKVSNYYKLVEVNKKGNEYVVKPIGKDETRIECIKVSKVVEMSVKDFYKNKAKRLSENIETNI